MLRDAAGSALSLLTTLTTLFIAPFARPDNDGNEVEDRVFQFRPGSRFGGPVGTQTVPDTDDDCTPGTGMTEVLMRNTGGEANVTNGMVSQSVAIALKFGGAINTATPDANLNWFEYSTLTLTPPSPSPRTPGPGAKTTVV